MFLDNLKYEIKQLLKPSEDPQWFTRGGLRPRAQLLLLSLILLVASSMAQHSYAVQYDDKLIGYVSSYEEGEQIARNVEEMVVRYKTVPDAEKMSKINILRQISLIPPGPSDQGEIENSLAKELDMYEPGFALMYGPDALAYFKTREDAQKVVTLIKTQYLGNFDKRTILDYYFEIPLTIESQDVELYLFSSTEEAIDKILHSKKHPFTYIIFKGDTISGIANRYGVTVEGIQEQNKDLDINRIYEGQQIELLVDDPLVRFVVEEEEICTEKISFETKVEYTDTMYEGQSKTIQNGINGEKRVTLSKVIVNGMLEESVAIEEEILKESVEKIVKKGTKERPKTLAYGVFHWPTNGRISSYFGNRKDPFSGKTAFHAGLDIANSTGTAVNAADGGRVVYSGSNGGYGLMIIIDHENGYKTYYGHNSKLLVRVGERVYRGQTIALMGSTGKSTGPHVHFEIRKKGSPTNPLNYLGKR